MKPFLVSFRRSFFALGVVVAFAITSKQWQNPPRSSDFEVATIGDNFRNHVNSKSFGNVKIQSQGVLKHTEDTFLWNRFGKAFGSNPNTPYMYVTLPLFGFLLPSPMWHMKQNDAAVLISRVPPEVEYFSYTTFSLWKPKTGLPFGSLGDSVNNHNIRQTDEGIFAYVATANQKTYEIVRQSLVASGIPANAVNLMAIPSSSDYGLFDDWTHFEIVLRLFRFKNLAQGKEYLQSNHPFFYVAAKHGQSSEVEPKGYKTREHRDNIQENDMREDFSKYEEKTLMRVAEAFKNKVQIKSRMDFGPLRIRGLDCLQENTECLGDCPDAAYLGLNVEEDSDNIEMQALRTDDEVHIVTLVNHRKVNASVYGSVAMLTSKSETISKTHMTKDVRATSIGVTSLDFPRDDIFVSWVFTRNQDHCAILHKNGMHGCTVIEDYHASTNSYITYCERIYLNPLTGTGPDYQTLLPARLFHIFVDPIEDDIPNLQFSDIRLPPSREVVAFDGDTPLRLLHIIKTGGESLENYLYQEKCPSMDYGACRKAAAMATNLTVNTSSPKTCDALATFTSSALCGLNCECCALDLMGGRFHGTLLVRTLLPFLQHYCKAKMVYFLPGRN